MTTRKQIQAGIIIRDIKEFGYTTNTELKVLFGIKNPSAVISKLVRKGYPIVSERSNLGNYNEYSLPVGTRTELAKEITPKGRNGRGQFA